MTTATTVRLLTPEEIALNAGQNFPRLLTPGPQVFAERALRLRQLAAGHAMRDYLLFIAQLAEAQDRALNTFPAVPLPSAAQLEAAAQSGRPALATASWPRDAAWQRSLHALLDDLAARLPEGSPTRAAAQAVRALPADALERQADRLLGGVMLGLDFAAAPFIAAGLQVYWTHLVSATQAAHAARTAQATQAGAAGDENSPGSAWGHTSDPTHCPCCASLPTASVTRIGSGSEGHRYLHCALCNAQWHMVRVKCSHCQGTKGIQYTSLQKLAEQAGQTSAATSPPAQPAVQAETCDSCGHYLKLMRMNKDPQIDPIADDLATVTLDLLVAETGMQRHGVNLMLLFGE